MPLKTVSYSSIKQWATCPRQGYLGQHLGLQRMDEPRTGAMPFGSRVHVALELFGKSHWRIAPALIWKKLMDREFEIAEEKGWPHNLDKESKLGQTMLEGFHDWMEEEGIFANWTVIGIEQKLHTVLTVRLDDGQEIDVRMQGKLDVRTQRNSDGAVFVDDYKTTASLSEDAIVAKLQESQGPLYTILERRQAPPDQWSAGFILTMLRKVQRGPRSNPPYYMRIVEPYSDAKLKAAERNIIAEITQIAGVVDKLEQGAPHLDVAPARAGWWCKTCPFRIPCMEMADGNVSGANRLILDNYVSGNPLARYDEDPANTLDALGLV
jgi:hypothetical protein